MVFEKANQAMNKPGKTQKTLKLYSEVYIDRKLTLFQQIITQEDEEPIKYSTFQPTTFEPWNVRKKRQGRPKMQWGQTAQRDYWNSIRKNLSSEHKEHDWTNTPEKRIQMLETARASQEAINRRKEHAN